MTAAMALAWQRVMLLAALVGAGALQPLSASAKPSSSPPLDYNSCASIVESFVEQEMASALEMKRFVEDFEGSQQQQMPDMLFFLHVPRAGGRSYNHCFLSSLLPPHLQCNMSYHLGRNDPDNPTCRLLATHDDFSMTSRLPPGSATGLTSLFRDPVERTISVYEMAMQIAGRSMSMDLRTFPDFTLRGAREALRDHFKGTIHTDTRNVWPWSVLAWVMEDDLWTRRDFHSIPPPPPGFEDANAYMKPHLAMTLAEFVSLPVVHDVVHNGATFQIVGITNNSINPEAHKVRECVLLHKSLGADILELAKARVEGFLHVGLTSKMEESISLLAAIIDRSLSSQPFQLPAPGWRPRSGSNCAMDSAGVSTMRKVFADCLKMEKELAVYNRHVVFKKFGPVYFSSEARKGIPKEVIDAIEDANKLDRELYKFATTIFERKLEVYRPLMESMKIREGEICEV